MGTTESAGAHHRLRQAVLALAVAGVVAGCTTVQRPVEDPHPRLAPEPSDGLYDDQVLVTAESEVGAEPGIEETEFYGGEGSFINETAARPRRPALSADGEIVLNFEGESVQSVVHTILG